jgi:multiple sugar transport system permease protein
MSALTSAAVPRRRREVSRRAAARREASRRAAVGYLFVAPFLVVFVAMLVVPLVYAGYLSLFREQLIGGTSFAGLDNYTRAFGDERLWQGVARVGMFFLIQVPIMLGIALAFALALDSGVLWLSRLFRLGFFVPYAVPGVVATLMWGYLYGPEFGPIAQLFEKLSLDPPNLLGSDLMLGSIANVVFWEFTGYNMILLYAALRAIPTELYEAAAVDGAGPWRTAWSVKIPALRPALLLALIFSVIGSFQLFNEPQLLQRLAPNVIDSAYTPNLYAYSLAFTSQDLNYAAAVSFLLGLVIVAVSYTVQLAANRRRT